MSDGNDRRAAAGDGAHAAALGLYDPPRQDGVTGIGMAAIGASVLWLLVVAGVVLLAPAAPGGPFPRGLLIALAVLVPLGLIWVAALTLRTAKSLHLQTLQFQAALEAMRRSEVLRTQNEAAHGDPDAVLARLDDISDLIWSLQAAQTAEVTAQPTETQAPAPAAAPAQQTSLVFESDTPKPAPLESDDFIRALNFPQTAEDTEGFAALRRAMRDRSAAQLIQAAEDVLTLLSQEGVYMDDLEPDRARPEIWRQFGQGQRGRPIAALGGVRDRTALALTAGRMKQDPIFRDAAHHFLRLFDKTFAVFEPEATDAEIAALAETRTARAFMLLGRVAGTFD